MTADVNHMENRRDPDDGCGYCMESDRPGEDCLYCEGRREALAWVHDVDAAVIEDLRAVANTILDRDPFEPFANPVVAERFRRLAGELEAKE